MRFNKLELQTLASQSPHKYEKQGVLAMQEKTEGFFRRTDVYVERWFRLCGNLLFYLRTKDHWSEAVGVIVLENFSIQADNNNKPVFQESSSYHFTICFHSGASVTLVAATETERSLWMDAILNASFDMMRSRLDSLRNQIQIQMSTNRNRSQTAAEPEQPIKQCGYVTNISESPLCEVSFSADNLLCDSHGRAPNARLITYVKNSGNSTWVKYAVSEVIEKSSNPVFLTTVSFRASDSISESSRCRFIIYDVRERTTQTQTVVGRVTVELGTLKGLDRIRLPLSTVAEGSVHVHQQNSGFLTISVWNLEREERTSTESTPCRTKYFEAINLPFSHRRTQSLPPRLGCKLKIPYQSYFHHIHTNPFVQTYRFHSGLGGDIFVHEIMAESKLSFQFPLQLLSLWIAEEKEQLQEMIGLGELREPWHSRQVQVLERHLWLINTYTQAKQNLLNHKGADFKQSSTKADPTFEFVPLNLHLQRMWAQNESLHKSGFHDIISVGAFTAYSQRYDNGGLVKMLQAWKKYAGGKGNKDENFIDISNKVYTTYESIQGIKRLRREVVERMQLIMKLAKEGKTQGLHTFVEDIYHRCRHLLGICDHALIEEAFEFLERQKLTFPTSTSLDFDLCEESQDRTLDEGIDTPNSPLRSIVEMFKKKNESLRAGKLEDRTPDSGLGFEDVVKCFLDLPSSNYYRPSEEPEPWDLTQVNIEASVISLNSKIKVISGVGADINSHFLRNPNTFQRSSLSKSQIIHSTFSSSKPPGELYAEERKVESDPEPSVTLDQPVGTNVGNISPPGASSAKRFTNVHRPPPAHLPVSMRPSEMCQTDWSEELRSSVKKLRLAMDGLLKTSRLAHSIFRLQENNEKAKLGYIARYRRDVCFSHALTTLTSGLMSRLWCRKPDTLFLFIVSRLGPLASFHSFLTYYSHEAEMFSDMMVAIEDLKTVQFSLVLHDPKSQPESTSRNTAYPVPKVLGSRSSIKVLLPVPEAVFSLLPLDSSHSTNFYVTPVFFNIGIDEQASFAERFHDMQPQYKSNLDNFARLNEYYRKFKKLSLSQTFGSKRSQTVEPSIDTLLDKMHSELLSKKKKNVEIIHLSAHVTRLMMGLRFSNCKSGKDRTSMAVTLEQCQILSQEYDLAEHEFQTALDAFRSEGCRRENTLKNIGQRKYAFNTIQAFALPQYYRPTPGTYGNVQS